MRCAAADKAFARLVQNLRKAVGGHWLGAEVVEAGRQRMVFLVPVSAEADEHRTRARHRGPGLLQNLVTVIARHLEVQEDDGWLEVLNHLLAGVPTERNGGSAAKELKQVCQAVASIRLVIDDESAQLGGGRR